MRARRALTLLLAAVVAPVPLLAAAPAQAKPGSRSDREVRAEAHRVDRVPTPRLSWFDCGELYAEGAQCTMAALPLDYDRPTGPTTQVAVLRIPATNPAQRIGSLFVNPGGPGGSGVELAAAARSFLSPAVLARFDVVGFDPRGVNLSDPVRCWPDAGTRDAEVAALFDGIPATRTEQASAVASAKAFGRACSTTGRPLAGSMSTAEAARDMDVLRRTLGDESLTYLGFSYGTYLGQVYANLFPDRVRAVAIDGVLDPLAWAGTDATRRVPQSVRVGSAEATAESLRAVLERCRAVGPDFCRLASLGDPVTVTKRVLAALKKAPLVIDDSGFTLTITYSDVVGALVDMLYSPVGGEDVDGFLSALDQARAASPSAPAAAARASLRRTMRTLARTRAAARRGPTARQRAAFGTRSAARGYEFPYVNDLDSFAAVSCTDGVHPWSASRWPALVEKADRAAPGFGALWAWQSAMCARRTWTVRDGDRYRGPFDRRTANPVLVVGTVHDPATPYSGAQAAARLLPGSRLLTSVGFGHTAFGTSQCVDDAVEQYLLDLRLPRRGARCDAVQPFTLTLAERYGVGPAGTLSAFGTSPGRPAAPARVSPDVLRRRPPVVPPRLP